MSNWGRKRLDRGGSLKKNLEGDWLDLQEFRLEISAIGAESGAVGVTLKILIRKATCLIKKNHLKHLLILLFKRFSCF